MANQESLSQFLAHVIAALSNCSLYSAEHPAVEEYSRKALSPLEDLFVDDVLNLTLLSDSLLFNEMPVANKGAHVSAFIKKLRAKGIERIMIRRGISGKEMRAFLTALSSRDDPVYPSQHVAIGQLEVSFKSEESPADLIDKNVEKVHEVYEGVSRYRRLDMRGIEDVVVGFISALKSEANVLRHLGPVRDHSQYTYVHETNVSILTIFQAEALGMDGESLHDAGIAGLLHDVGKLFVPKEIIEKKAKLDDSEWDTMKLHPVLGASYLSSIDGISKLAVIAAYEHHMKHDGSGYPRNSRMRNLHLISQLVAIADVFDALRTVRSYRSALEIPRIVGILNEGAGRDFNPDLLQNFLLAFRNIEAL